MDKLKEKLLSIFIVSINFIVFLKVLKESFKIEDFNYSFMLLLVLFGILIYLFYSFILEKKKYKIIFTTVLLGIAAVLLYKYKDTIFSYYTKDFINNVISLNQAFLKEKTTYFYQYKGIFTIIIPIIVSVLLFFNGVWKNSIIFFNLMFMISFWYTIFYKVILNNIYYFLGVALITFAINSFQKKIGELRVKEIKINMNLRHVLLYSIVVTLIVIRVVSILPQEYNGSNLNEIVDFWENKFTPKGGTMTGNLKNAVQGKYVLMQSGYSDSEAKLGGPLTINKKEVFRVKSDKPYYLKGTVRDYYSGKSWLYIEDLVNQKSEEYNFNRSGLKLPSEGESDEQLKVKNKEVVIFPSKNLNSTSFFIPNHSYDVISDYKGVFYTTIPTFMSDIEVRDPYTVKYYSYEKYEDYIEGIQNKPQNIQSKGEAYTLPLRYMNEPYLNYKNRVESKLLPENNNEIISEVLDKQEKYFQLDSKIDEKVYELLNKILASTGKPVDKLTNYEKASAIRNYLTKNYPYTLNVSEVPEGKDFVSYFLFEEKKGYCTYFASATTILCRMAGIPARYVEGFKTPDNKDGDGKYMVTNAEAHAWSEILINPQKDIWVVVDPSPTPTEFEARNNTNINNENSNNPEGNQGGVTTPNKERPNKNDIEEDEGNSSINVYSNELFGRIAVITAISLYILIKVLSQKRKLRLILSSSSIIPLYHYYIERLESIGIQKPSSSGDLEFVETLKDSELRERIRTLAELSYEEFYGGLTRNQLDKKEYLLFIESFAKKKDKRFSYEMKKYFSITNRFSR